MENETGRKARILVITGDGKGKTTSSLGMVVRAVGHDMRVLMIHFIKADDTVGEVKALRRLPNVEVRVVGRGFLPRPDSPKLLDHQEAARHAWQQLVDDPETERFELIVLDELCSAVRYGLIALEPILEWLDTRPASQAIVLTGRDAPRALIEKADTVSEILHRKHGYDQGIQAQKGIEF